MKEEINNIIAGALLDGQNQIHDLRGGKATAQEIEERMFKSLAYWCGKMDKLLTPPIE